MSIGPDTTLREIAFIVGTALEEAGVSAVLSGGGAATVYAPDKNQSRDLDFVMGFWSSLGASAECVLNLGFQEKGGSYVHPATTFTLEFPQGPLMIGNEVLTEWITLREDGMVLQIISPTDCVRDRLSWFLFYNTVDYSALHQALGVAAGHEIDLQKIAKWALSEGGAERYAIFEDKYLREVNHPPEEDGSSGGVSS